MKRMITLVLALAMVLSLAACGGGDTTPPAGTAPQTTQPAGTTPVSADPAGAGTRSFTDSVGRTVEVPAEITRIAPSGPLAQMVLFALAPDMFVGVANEWSKDAEQYLDTEYYNLPLVGQLYGGQEAMNLETLAAADPQVIIDVGEPKDSIVEDLDELQAQTGIPYVHITATIQTMGDAYRKLGELLGLEEEGEAIASYCENTYNEILALMDEVGEENKARVLYRLGDTGTNIIATGSYHSEILDLMTNNLAVVDSPSSKGTGNESDMEQFYLWDPDYIIFAPESVYSLVGDDPAWQELHAIAEGNYCEVPNGPYNWMGFPPSVQRILGMLWLGKQLYPDQADYDLYEKVAEYYDIFYHCDLTQEQYDALTANSLHQ